METLAQLTPAETYLISNNSNATFRELLKLTLADLCLKQVLRIEERELQSHPNNPIRILKYILIGRNFHNHIPKAHEIVFLSPFRKSPEIEILFNHLIRMGYENAGSRKRYIFNSLLMNPGVCTKFTKVFLLN